MTALLETERLLIRPPDEQEEDEEFIQILLSDPDVGRFYPGMNPEKAIEVAHWTLDHWLESRHWKIEIGNWRLEHWKKGYFFSPLP
jgi:hypothetical protein